MRPFISAFFVAFVIKTCTGADWCYRSQEACDSHCTGPEHWKDLSPDCANSRQSPINILTSMTTHDPNLSPLVLSGYQETLKTTLINDGITFFGTIPHLATIKGGKLNGTYKALRYYFHWGDKGGPGSEHTIDGERYPMELHIVHMKEHYKTLSDAIPDPEGVALLGFFFKLSETANPNYDNLITSLKKVVKSGTNTTLSTITLNTLILSENKRIQYYRYAGSETTPECSEAVIWTVYEKKILLSRQQLEAFSDLKFKDGKAMVKNYRPLQPVHDRQVYTSFVIPPRAPAEVSGAKLRSGSLLLCISTALGLFQLN